MHLRVSNHQTMASRRGRASRASGLGRSLAVGLVIGLVAAVAAPAWAGWEEEKAEDGITVSSREVSGSDLKEFKGLVYMDTTIQSLVALMNDTEAATKWLHDCKEAKVAKDISTAERVTYTVVNAPWPLDDRDMYVHSKISYDRAKEQISIKLTGKEGFAPKKDGKVRVRSIRGWWVFTQTKSGKVRVVYQIYSDAQAPSDSAANGAMEDAVFESLKNMRRLVQKAPYKGYKFPDEMIKAIEK
ncbi:MAG: hypothetical protein Tsb0020_32290 [Haliangiales bacterium]